MTAYFWFFIGTAVGAAVICAAAIISTDIEDKKARARRKAKALNDRINSVHTRIDGAMNRITSLERDEVILNKRADCALAYADAAVNHGVSTHEQLFHAPKSRREDTKKK